MQAAYGLQSLNLTKAAVTCWLSHGKTAEQVLDKYKRLMAAPDVISLYFYSTASPCPLPINNLPSALKATTISRHSLLRNSQDALVFSCVPKLETGA